MVINTAQLGELRQHFLPMILPCSHWVAVTLRDAEGNPVASARVEVTTPDGMQRRGTTEQYHGAVEHAGFAAAGDCRIVFPDYDESMVVFG